MNLRVHMFKSGSAHNAQLYNKIHTNFRRLIHFFFVHLVLFYSTFVSFSFLYRSVLTFLNIIFLVPFLFIFI